MEGYVDDQIMGREICGWLDGGMGGGMYKKMGE